MFFETLKLLFGLLHISSKMRCYSARISSFLNIEAMFVFSILNSLKGLCSTNLLEMNRHTTTDRWRLSMFVQAWSSINESMISRVVSMVLQQSSWTYPIQNNQSIMRGRFTWRDLKQPQRNILQGSWNQISIFFVLVFLTVCRQSEVKKEAQLRFGVSMHLFDTELERGIQFFQRFGSYFDHLECQLIFHYKRHFVKSYLCTSSLSYASLQIKALPLASTSSRVFSCTFLKKIGRFSFSAGVHLLCLFVGSFVFELFCMNLSLSMMLAFFYGFFSSFCFCFFAIQ